ncbi:hypothetical protein Ava_B0254 (plasmid) [Trichormus variabilis ATCC 29413]|nr:MULTISPECIES: IS630-like element ISAva6 family transposase [Nostocaceae]ABA19755.1 hypothetical protein Ava_0129 [Trichormus variabilis ATCC 29413]ABA20096.1 hypothetical protein Ava_0472 [Trichormus variabilis ATCC 29413]ABA20797.1 hypothetical protein Ava_1173 [Trichormus variabilis ATCC 29413]ABA20829.1 hypothetical protein Ava_1205 [Trichormus variabilis ATCC 29413]ABA21228.1 hypothetical protein Ava_1605 [Trichormus variabilis ATCC 29413]
MVRPRIKLTEHLSTEEIEQSYRRCEDAQEKTRWLVIKLLNQQPQLSAQKVAEIVGFSGDWVRKIVRRYNKLGANGIINQQKLKPGGKKLALTNEQQQWLRQRLASPPEDGGLWSAPKVGELIRVQFGITLHVTTAWDYLKRLGFSLQQPRPLHTEAATFVQRQMFKTELTEFVRLLRFLHPHKSVEVWAEDEARLGLKPIVRRVWTPVGHRPNAVHRTRYQWLYTYGFVHPATGESFFLILPRVNIAVMQMALDAFAAEVNPHHHKIIVLLVDQAGWHTSKQLMLPAGIILFPLPAYTPQLQPTECVWSLLREAVANQMFSTLDELETVLISRCQWLMSHPQIVHGKVGFDWICQI